MVCALLACGQVTGAPLISDFSPTAGTAGDQIQLNGSGFSAGGFTIRFWNGGSGVVVTNGFINSDTLLTVSVPSGITTGPISIQQGTGTPSYTAADFLAIGPGPFITGFTPLLGSVGDSISIAGVHFANPTGVLFNGTNAPEFTANSAGTQITTRVPTGATSGAITVSTLNGTSNSPSSFTVVGRGPFITDFSPVSGIAGTKIQIDGLHFTGVTNVTFNGQPGIIVAATSDTLIQVQAPAGLTTGPIAINTVQGNFVTSSNFYGNPTITNVTPNFGRAGTNISIVGNNLLGASAVSFGGVASGTFSVVNNSNLTAAVPAGAITGLIRVVVPGASAFSPANFVVRPTISSFSPSFGPAGTSVKITGANLNAGTPAVNFNGVPTAPPTGITFGQVTVLVPPGATTGRIGITTADGGDTNANLFYVPASISGFTPTNSGPGSRITITGQNFIGAGAVNFNGQAASDFTVTNNSSIGATVPANVITGPISITTPAGTASSAGVFYGAPAITSFTPTHGLPGASVTIKGVNFLGGKVQFGSLSAAILSLNNTQIVATVPGGAQTGPITVSGPAGTNVSIGKFILDYTSDLQVGITNSPNPVTVGSNLVYTISVFNAGPNDAPNTTLTNVLPANAILRSVSISSPWVLATNGNTLTASVSSFGWGNSIAVTLVVTPQVSGNITDTVSVGSDNPDPIPGDNTESSTATVEPLALLSIKRIAGQVTISWPMSLTNYVLQFQDRLAPIPRWLVMTNAPLMIGGLETVTDTNNGTGRFYRLQR